MGVQWIEFLGQATIRSGELLNVLFGVICFASFLFFFFLRQSDSSRFKSVFCIFSTPISGSLLSSVAGSGRILSLERGGMCVV